MDITCSQRHPSSKHCELYHCPCTIAVGVVIESSGRCVVYDVIRGIMSNRSGAGYEVIRAQGANPQRTENTGVKLNAIRSGDKVFDGVHIPCCRSRGEDKDIVACTASKFVSPKPAI